MHANARPQHNENVLTNKQRGGKNSGVAILEAGAGGSASKIKRIPPTFILKGYLRKPFLNTADALNQQKAAKAAAAMRNLGRTYWRA